jgi:DNA-binding CsgD family transcriptional regulator
MTVEDGTLATTDVRALLRLVGELRELGAQPPRWRRHLVESLARLCGTRAALAGELQISRSSPDTREGIRLVHREEAGVGPLAIEAFENQVVWNTHGPNEAIAGSWSAYAGPFTAARRQLVDDQRWYQTALAHEQFRSFDCDDFIVSMMPIPSVRVMTSIKLFRGWGDRRFAPRERLLVELLSEELARDWADIDSGDFGGLPPGRSLGPRLRQVLSLFAAGASEKEVAATLRISPSTVHDYAKALHRAFGVRSRGELLARVRPSRLRTRLVSEPAGS